MRPSEAERDAIDSLIMDELVNGVCKPAAIAYLQQVFARMQHAGCDAVILGCTELPLIMNDTNSPLPTLDSTRLLARAALLRAVGRGPLRAQREKNGNRVGMNRPGYENRQLALNIMHWLSRAL